MFAVFSPVLQSSVVVVVSFAFLAYLPLPVAESSFPVLQSFVVVAVSFAFLAYLPLPVAESSFPSPQCEVPAHVYDLSRDVAHPWNHQYLTANNVHFTSDLSLLFH